VQKRTDFCLPDGRHGRRRTKDSVRSGDCFV
jgi:hypothetical protein